MYWMQEQTLFQHVIRGSHDFMAPFGEYITLHLYFISGSDRFLFLSQWLAYLSSVVLCVLISKEFFDKKIRSDYLALFAAALPIAVLQSSSTQTDLVTTVIVLLSTYYALRFRKMPSLRNSLAVGLSIGLGILTKATFVIFSSIPIAILVLVIWENKKNWKKIITLLAVAVLLSLTLQLRFFSQNLSLFGSISGQPIIEEGSGYTNELLSGPIIISNLIRNSFINLPLPFINIPLQSLIYIFHDLINLDPNDPKTTYSGTLFKVSPIIYPQEDIVASPFHFVLILVGGVFILFNRRSFKDSKLPIFIYTISIASFFIFSSLLKWQPFHSRLLIPFLLIGSISSYVILAKQKYLELPLKIVVSISVILAFLLAILNVSRSYLPYKVFIQYINHFTLPLASVPEPFFQKSRISQYFNSRYYWEKPYRQVIDQLEINNSSQEISFHLMDEFEYPFWVLLKDAGLNFHVTTYTDASEGAILITTSKESFKKDGFVTSCYKTELEYGFACISQKR
jgi:4-amino-4-deoxy-L-arabinose transferase-like glycosyltransferase